MQQHGFFNVRLRHYTHLVFFTFCSLVAFSVGASAQDKCPKIDSHETVAIKFQLFSAYQTGFDGYEMPCEMKCFGNSNCQQRCQSKKALEYLSKQMTKLKNKRGLKQCASFTLVCLEQCQSLGPKCAQACDGSTQVGSIDTE